MVAVSIRNLSPETHRALKSRAAARGHSTEAEIRRILDEAVRDEHSLKLGSLLADIGREAGGFELAPRDRASYEPLDLT